MNKTTKRPFAVNYARALIFLLSSLAFVGVGIIILMSSSPEEGLLMGIWLTATFFAAAQITIIASHSPRFIKIPESHDSIIGFASLIMLMFIVTIATLEVHGLAIFAIAFCGLGIPASVQLMMAKNLARIEPKGVHIFTNVITGWIYIEWADIMKLEQGRSEKHNAILIKVRDNQKYLCQKIGLARLAMQSNMHFTGTPISINLNFINDAQAASAALNQAMVQYCKKK